MSQADLEFCQELPKIRVQQLSPMIKQIQTPEPSQPKPSASSAAATPAVRIRAIAQRRDGGADEDLDDESGCRTPTAKEHRIPPVLTCPPAPRKPARAPACKRKLAAELDFFEVANRAEVEEFFRSSFVGKSTKRNCCPCK